MVPVVVIVVVRDEVTKLVAAIVGAPVVPRSNGVLVAGTRTGLVTVVMLGGTLPREGTVVERGAVGDGSRVEDGASVGDCDGGELVIARVVGTNVRIVGTDEGRCVGKGGDVGVAVGRCVIGSTFVDGL